MKEYIIQETEEMTTFGSVWKRYEPVVELIRCKDCKRYIEQAHECDALNQGCIKPDFFCGYGKRKDGGRDGK